MIWDPFERFFWGIAFTLLIITALIYLHNGKQRENRNEKALMFGFACWFIGIAFDRLFRFLSDFFIQGSFRNLVFYGEYSNFSPTFIFLRKLAYLSWCLGFILFVFSFEFVFKRTKFLFSILGIILSLFILIVPFDLAQTFMLLFYAIAGYFLMASIIIMFKWARLEFKRVTFFVIMGIFFITSGFGISTFQVKQLNIIPLIVPPIFYILGALIIIFPIFVNLKFFTKKNRFLYLIISILCISLNFLQPFFNLFTDLDVFIKIYGFVNYIVIILFIYFLVKNLMSESESKIEEERELLKIFTKPQKVTEEEVSVAKERKICLVCKGKLARAMYICPDCSTFYCKKCSETLSNLENACWVCESPFDESKPKKLHEEKEEKIIFEDKTEHKS